MPVGMFALRVMVHARALRIAQAHAAYEDSRRDKGDIIRMARSELGMSIYEFAKALGVSPTYISKLENNKVPMSLALLERLEKMLQETTHD